MSGRVSAVEPQARGEMVTSEFELRRSNGEVPLKLARTSLRADPTPELLTSVESPTESANSYAIQKNLNLRMMLDDAARVIYIDRPSRLNPAPIPD